MFYYDSLLVGAVLFFSVYYFTLLHCNHHVIALNWETVKETVKFPS